MADAFSLTFDDDDLLGPAASILPSLPIYTSANSQAAQAAAGSSSLSASAHQCKRAESASPPSQKSIAACTTNASMNNAPTMSSKAQGISDFMLSQLSLTGPAFEYSIQNSQEKSQLLRSKESSAPRGQVRHRAADSIPDTLTQSPIKRSRLREPSDSLSADHGSAGHALPQPAPGRPPLAPPRQQGDNAIRPRRIPGPAGVLDSIVDGVVAEVGNISVTQQRSAAHTSGAQRPNEEVVPCERETVVEEWLSCGAWRQMCIDLDLPSEAAPAGLYPGAQASMSASAPAASPAVIPLKRFQQQAEGNTRMCWKSVPGLAVLVTAFRSTAAGGLAVVQDWTGCVRALIARDVLQDFGTAVAVGSCLALVGVSIVQPAPGRLYLNIRSSCIARVYPPDCPQPKLRSTQQQHSQTS